MELRDLDPSGVGLHSLPLRGRCHGDAVTEGAPCRRLGSHPASFGLISRRICRCLFPPLRLRLHGLLCLVGGFILFGWIIYGVAGWVRCLRFLAPPGPRPGFCLGWHPRVGFLSRRESLAKRAFSVVAAPGRLLRIRSATLGRGCMSLVASE